MSLLDALLLEPTPLKTPTAQTFYVALRNDGALGSGTAHDPWNGSTVHGDWLSAALQVEAEKPVSLSWELIGSQRELKVTVTTGTHSFSVGDFVTISGVTPAAYNGQSRVKSICSATECYLAFVPPPETGDPTSPGDCRSAMLTISTTTPHGLADHDVVEIAGVEGGSADCYNWQFVIQLLSSTSFRCHIASFVADPAGSPKFRKVVFGLDTVLNSLPQGDGQPTAATLYIGPGVFETRGNLGGWIDAAGQRHAWRVWPGQKFIGSGIDVTTLKVVVAELPISYVSYGAIGVGAFNELTDGAEVSDLTVDSNMAAHPHRVPVGDDFKANPYSILAKTAVALNSSHTRVRRVRVIDFGTQTMEAECFPLGMGPTHPANPEVTDTVMEECIAEKPSRNSIRETTCMGAYSDLSYYFRGCELRHCVLDGRYPSGVPGYYLNIVALAAAPTPSTPLRYRITTGDPHGKEVNDHVVISRVLDPAFNLSSVFNGVHAIKAVTSPYDLEVDLASTPEHNLSDYFLVVATVGVSMQGPGVDAGSAAVAHHNRVHHMNMGANHDTWSSNDALYQNNYYSDVQVAMNQTVKEVYFFPLAGSGLARDGSVARFTALLPHGLAVGNTITVEGATYYTSGNYNATTTVVEVIDEFTFTYAISGFTAQAPNAEGTPVFQLNGTGPHYSTYIKRLGDVATFTTHSPHFLLPGQVVLIGNAGAFDGIFEVLDVPPSPQINGKPTSFTYRLKPPYPSGNATGTPTWREVWRTRNLAFESNVIARARRQTLQAGTAVGIDGRADIRNFSRVAVQDNIIRHFHDLPDPQLVAGIVLASCGQAVVQGNVLGLAGTGVVDQHLLPYRNNGRVAFFNNQRPTGEHLAGYETTLEQEADELSHRIEDSQLFAL